MAYYNVFSRGGKYNFFAFAEDKANWNKNIGIIKKVINDEAKSSNNDNKKLKNVMGNLGIGILRQGILNFTKKNKPKTIARKGFNRSLIDTGQLINSIDKKI